MSKNNKLKVKMYAIEPDAVKMVSDYIGRAKKKTGMSIRRLVTEILRDAVESNRFNL